MKDWRKYREALCILIIIGIWTAPAKADDQRIKEGVVAPDFSLPDQDGQLVQLHPFRGHKAVVLYFYPKDDTPGCTKEAQGFTARLKEFEAAGAVVIGVSGDSIASHKKFATKHGIPYRLIADTENKLRTLYGVPKGMVVMPGRVTYVIDKTGVVRTVYESMSDAEGHVERSLATVKALQGAR